MTVKKDSNVLKTMQGEIKSLCKKLKRCEEIGEAREETARPKSKGEATYPNRGVNRDYQGIIRNANVRPPPRAPLRCYLCSGPHMVRDCP